MGFFGKIFGKKTAEQNTPQCNDRYNTLLNDCLAELGAKNRRLADQYGLGSHARWDVDQNTGILTFSNEGIPAVVCDVDFSRQFLQPDEHMALGMGQQIDPGTTYKGGSSRQGIRGTGGSDGPCRTQD